MTNRKGQRTAFCACERALLCPMHFVPEDLTLWRRLT